MTMRVQWSMRKTAGGYEGLIVLPGTWDQLRQQVTRVTPGRIVLPPGFAAGKKRKVAIKASSDSAAGALSKAAGVAASLLGNPLVAAALPPGTGVAVKGIQMLADSAVGGKLKGALSALTGPGAKRLGSALSKLKFW